MSHPLFDRHRATIDRALVAIAERSYWSAFRNGPAQRLMGKARPRRARPPSTRSRQAF